MVYTTRGEGCGLYSEWIIVESKMLKWAHSWLGSFVQQPSYRPKSAVRKQQLCSCELYYLPSED